MGTGQNLLLSVIEKVVEHRKFRIMVTKRVTTTYSAAEYTFTARKVDIKDRRPQKDSFESILYFLLLLKAHSFL